MSERFITSTLNRRDTVKETTLRPPSFDQFPGQFRIKEQLELFVRAAKERDEALAAKAEAEATKVHVSVEAELEAYRRAERVERLAHERVEQLYHQANGTLADAAIKVEDASNQINTLSDLVSAQLTQLQNAVTGSKQALQEATAGLYAIRPNTEEN
jgi:uncharacterized protein YPO0396